MTEKKDIVHKLCKKAVTKQSVHRTTKGVFETLKESLQEVAEDLNNQMCTIDKHVEVAFKDKGDFEAEIRFSGDVLVFHMHTNTFQFEKSHHIWSSSYVKEDPYRAYCGVINIYNFLSDSFKYNRDNDLGYLIGRLFINKEGHYFIEGKGKLGFLYNNFPSEVCDKEALSPILLDAIAYAMDFELHTPPFNEVQVVTLHQIKEMSQNMKLQTAKRLGFRFSSEK